jgi:hypothetical protein
LDDRCEIVGQANRGSFGLRATPGHREADLMLFARYGQAVSTVHERHSRLLLATRPPSKAAEGRQSSSRTAPGTPAEALHVGTLPDGDRPILMPGNKPIRIKRLVEREHPDRLDLSTTVAAGQHPDLAARTNQMRYAIVELEIG